MRFISVPKDWVEDCRVYRGVTLNGLFAHWCSDYDGLPVDETCWGEWPCACAEDLLKELLRAAANGGENADTVPLDCVRRWQTILNKVMP
jgi:hypothetical protein